MLSKKLIAAFVMAGLLPVPATAQSYYMREKLKAKVQTAAYTGTWVSGAWTTGACTKGSPMRQTRSVTCTSGGSTVPDSQCDPASKPATSVDIGTCRNSCSLTNGVSGRSSNWNQIATYAAGSPQASRTMVSLGAEMCGASAFSAMICEAHRDKTTGEVRVYVGTSVADPAFGSMSTSTSEQAAGYCNR